MNGDYNIKKILKERSSSNKFALISEHERVTYRELHEYCLRAARELEAIFPSGNIGLFLPGSVNYIRAYFTCAYMGRTVVPLSVSSKKAELQSTLEYCDVSAVITEEKYVDRILESGVVCLCFCMDTGAYYGKAVGRDAAPSDVFVLIHTSGTTGLPKRVMLTHENLLENAKAITASLKLNENDIALSVLPFFLATGNMQIIQHVMSGNTIVIYEGMFVPGRVMAMVFKYGVTVVTCVTFMAKAFLHSANPELFASVRLISVGAGIVPPDIVEGLLKRFPRVEAGVFYGMTEASPRVTQLTGTDSEAKASSVGKVIDGVSVRIVDETGKRCGPGESGEITVRGKNIMKGYYKRPEQTAQVLRNGWLRSGDIGYLDGDGFLYLTGRKKNVIISAGYNIYPEEIEAVLNGCPGVDDAMVYGIPDDMYGEVVGAKIVAEKPLTAESIISYLKPVLQPMKIPKYIEFTDKLEKTQNGKLIRKRAEL